MIFKNFMNALNVPGFDFLRVEDGPKAKGGGKMSKDGGGSCIFLFVEATVNQKLALGIDIERGLVRQEHFGAFHAFAGFLE